MPKYKLIHPQCIYSHIEYLMSLIDLRREIQIRLNLLNLLQLFIFGMMWAVSYKSCSPYVSIVLGILSMTTLAWIGICQQRHIQKLGETITHLCMDSPFNDEDQSDRVSESGQYWDWVYLSETNYYLSLNEGYTHCILYARTPGLSYKSGWNNSFGLHMVNII